MHYVVRAAIINVQGVHVRIEEASTFEPDLPAPGRVLAAGVSVGAIRVTPAATPQHPDTLIKV